MNTTRTMLDERIDLARHRLADAASRAMRSDASTHDQVEAEQALDDVVHWIDARSKVLSDGTYRPDGAHSFVADAVLSIRHGHPGAQRRMKVDRELRSTSASYGGQVVPQYLIDQARLTGNSGRPVCDLLSQPLIDVGMTMVVVRLQGTTAEAQSAENTAATADDPSSVEISLPVVAALATATLSIQIVERAVGGSFDRVIGGDMMRAVDAEQERLVLNGSGSSGEPTGLLNQSGIGTVALTSTSAADLLDAVSNAAQQSHAATGEPADTVVLAPRRWRRILADSTVYGAAVSAAVAPSGPVRGQLLGLDVVVSGAMPTTLSTNRDAIIVMRRSDVVMAEAPPEMIVSRDRAGADKLEAKVTANRHFATGAIRPAGVVKVTGAGLANPYP